MDRTKSNKGNFLGSSNSFVIIFITAVILLVYLPMMLYLRSIPYKQRVVIDDKKAELSYPVFAGDSVYYAVISQNIINHHIFSDGSKEPLTPATFVMPLYPFLLAVFKFVFGSLSLFPLLQMIFTGLTSFIIFLLGRKFFSEKVGFFGSALYILDPTVIFHSLIVMTDITYVFFLVFSVWLLFGSDFKNPYLVSFVSGLVLGLSMLTRVVSTFLIILIAPVYFFAKIKEMGWKKIFINIIIILFGYSLVIVPWIVRNKEVSGVWGIASEKSVNLFHYYVPEFLSFKNNISVDSARNILMDDLKKKIGNERANDWSLLPNSSATEGVALKYIKNDVFGYAKFHLIKTIPFFLSSGVKNFIVSYNNMLGYSVFETNHGNMTNLLFKGKFGQFMSEIKIQPWVTLEEIYWGFVAVFMLIALFFSKSRFYVLFFTVVILYFAILTGPIAYSRFRLPALPFMLLLACEGFGLFKSRLWPGVTNQ